MKKFLFMGLIGIIFIAKPTNVAAQSTNRIDTIKYISDTIVAQKTHFQQKKLNNILQKLHLNVKSYNYNSSVNDKNIVNSITLFFDNDTVVANKFQHKKSVPLLVIYFQNSISFKEALVLFNKTNGNWTAVEKNYYGNLTVKDVKGLKSQNR